MYSSPEGNYSVIQSNKNNVKEYKAKTTNQINKSVSTHHPHTHIHTQAPEASSVRRNPIGTFLYVRFICQMMHEHYFV